MTAALVNITFTLNPPELKKTERKPFVINMEKIPETRPAARSAAPPKPFVDTGRPIAVDDDIMPDEIVIAETPPEPGISSESAESSAADPSADNGGEQDADDFVTVEEMPRKLNNVVPLYPEMAERAGIEGSVDLKVLVGVNGTVDSVVVLDGPKIFVDSAIDAAKRTRFSPAKYGGRPVACWVLMPFRFMRND